MNRNVRIADDSELQRAVYRELLGRRAVSWDPCQVDGYVGGAELIAAVKADFDRGLRTPVCILDQNMGKVTGIETAAQLHAIDPGILMVIITASDLGEIQIPDNLRQRLFILSKPTDPLVLRAQVGVMLQLWADKRHMEEQEVHLRQTEDNLKSMWESLREERKFRDRNNSVQHAFVTAVTHEVQTPMNGILGITQILQNSNLDDNQAQFVKSIEQSARQLLSVLGDILDFTHFQSGNLALDVTRTNICEIFDSVMDVCAPMAHEKNLKIHALVSEEVSELWECDGGRIRQMLFNLVSNAVKFTKKGEILFGVELESPRSENLRFWVRDTGIGMSDQTIAELFNAFRQEQKGMDREYGGLGLGLAITAELVNLMNGTIGVESTLGKGSHFWFQVPLVRMGSAQRPSASQKVLLVALRHSIARESVCSHLQRLSYLTESTNEIEAIQEIIETGIEMFSGYLIEDYFYDQLTAQQKKLLSNGLEKSNVLVRSPGNNLNKAEGFNWLLPEPVTYEALRSIYGSAVDLPLFDGVDRSGIRILIVEDHPLNRKVAEKSLVKAGYAQENLAMAEDGEDALRILQERIFDIILMDCQMPRMDGFKCSKAIRAGEGREMHQKIPIIALTANTTSSDRKASAEAGMNAFAPKPIQAERLDETIIRSWLLYKQQYRLD